MPKYDTNMDQLIKLKLKKPREWKWELNTSYSSPHIPLPIIQLYDHKNNLLIETKSNDRKSWGNNLEPKLPHRTKSYTPSYTTTLTTSDRIKIKESLLKKSTSDVSNKNPRKTSSVNSCDMKSVNSERSQNKYILRSSNAGTLLIRKDTITDEVLRRRKRRESIRLSVLNSDSDEETDCNVNKIKTKSCSSKVSSKSSRANEVSSTGSFNTINPHKYHSYSSTHHSKYV